jgi:hypothetical protein
MLKKSTEPTSKSFLRRRAIAALQKLGCGIGRNNLTINPTN